MPGVGERPVTKGNHVLECPAPCITREHARYVAVCFQVAGVMLASPYEQYLLIVQFWLKGGVCMNDDWSYHSESAFFGDWLYVAHVLYVQMVWLCYVRPQLVSSVQPGIYLVPGTVERNIVRPSLRIVGDGCCAYCRLSFHYCVSIVSIS